MFIDSHAHIDGQLYDEDRTAILARAAEVGIELILEICNGDLEQGSLEKGLALAQTHSHIYAAVGVHPHDARLYDDELEARLCQMCEHPKVLAWGEIGLDYYYDHSPRDVQQAAFVRQMERARERNLPILLHIRDADEDTIELLRQHWSDRGNRAGIFHCFSGSAKLAQAGLDLGFLISFSGNLTFKNAQSLRDIAKSLPLESILIETDCPYLSPVPYRGKRNEPAYVIEVARQLAELHQTTVEEIGRITTANFKRLFGMNQNTIHS